MHIKKKKSIRELKMDLEQFIKNTGRSKDEIHSDYNNYCTLKKRIDNTDSRRYDDDIRRMKDLHDDYLLGMNIRNRQNKINAARKVTAAPAAAAATAATIATFNLANTSNITNTSISTCVSTLINGNEITASFESTPPPSFNPSTTSSLPVLGACWGTEELGWNEGSRKKQRDVR